MHVTELPTPQNPAWPPHDRLAHEATDMIPPIFPRDESHPERGGPQRKKPTQTRVGHRPTAPFPSPFARRLRDVEPRQATWLLPRELQLRDSAGFAPASPIMPAAYSPPDTSVLDPHSVANCSVPLFLGKVKLRGREDVEQVRTEHLGLKIGMLRPDMPFLVAMLYHIRVIALVGASHNGLGRQAQ